MDFKSLVYGSAYKLRYDERFLISDEYFEWDIKFRSLKRYELDRMKLGDICTRIGNVFAPITEYPPYKYFKGDVSGYDKFCRTCEKSRERFRRLIDSLDTVGYNPKYVIILDYDNAILDGLHRSSYLLYKYGADFEVPVLRVEYKKRTFWQRLLRSYHKKCQKKNMAA